MDPIDRLGELFSEFPGIGKRQAGRFVQYLLRSSASRRKELIDAISSLSGSVRQCTACMRFWSGARPVCSRCSREDRSAVLAIVAVDADIEALERSGVYRGHYFVLGNLISLASDKSSLLRMPELKRRIDGLKSIEVIIALPANPEGDMTAARIREEIVLHAPAIQISMLGRGLSTGSELEYADPDTLKYALSNRK